MRSVRAAAAAAIVLLSLHTFTAAASSSAPSCPHVLFAYFHNEAETLYYAGSEDGAHWTPLNNNQPVLVTTPTLRDPFVNRLPNGGFRMVATNGDNYGAGDTILSFFSVDLITWSPVDILPLMGPAFFPPPATIGDLWAPEWHYDALRQDFVIFWAARGSGIMPTLPSPNCTGTQDFRFAFFYTRTTDWRNFSQPQILFDPGCYVTGDGGIDGDIVVDDAGTFTLVYKDARGVGEGHTVEESRGIRLAYSDVLAGPYSYPNASISDLLVPTLVEAPQIYAAPDNCTLGEGRFLYFDCSFWPTPAGWPRPPYGVAWAPNPFVANNASFTFLEGACTANSTDVSFPLDATHGSFLCVSDEEYADITGAFPPA